MKSEWQGDHRRGASRKRMEERKGAHRIQIVGHIVGYKTNITNGMPGNLVISWFIFDQWLCLYNHYILILASINGYMCITIFFLLVVLLCLLFRNYNHCRTKYLWLYVYNRNYLRYIITTI